MRHGRPQPPRILLALSLAGIALAASGCGSSDGSASTATSTAPAVTTPRPAATTPTTTAPATTATTPSESAGSLITGSANGKQYRCIGPDLLQDLRAMSRRIERGRESLKRIRSELRRLKRRYPNKVAPPRVAQRYNYLVRKHNGLLRLGNRRVRAYNQRLERDCLNR